VTDQDARYDPRFDFVVNEPEGKGRDTNFLATVLEQSRLNRIAAIYTALAILFQAAASSPLLCGHSLFHTVYCNQFFA
jgi:hypothetical protein